MDGDRVRRHSHNEMKDTRPDSRGARGSTTKALHSDTALFLTGLAFALAMLSLLAVLAFANRSPLSDVAPFVAVPVLLFIYSGVLSLNWMEGEGRAAATEEAAHRSSMRRSTRRRSVPNPVQRRRARRPSAAARR